MNGEIPSRANEFYQRLLAFSEAERAKFLKGLIGNSAESESEYLDFKRADCIDLKGDILKEIWSKALSGFANSDGGVLVWGIDAPTNVPLRLAVAPDINGLRARLLELQPNATEPPVRGADVTAIPETPSTTSGFVVCLIPPSPWKPHQAKWPRNEFFIRVGDNCIPASYSQVRALFQPNLTANFRVEAQADWNSQHIAGQEILRIAFWIYNAGPATADDVFVLFREPGGLGRLKPHSFWKSTSSAYSGKAVMAERSIHPTERINLFSAQLGIRADKDLLDKTFEFSFVIFARHQTPAQFSLTFKASQFPIGKKFEVRGT